MEGLKAFDTVTGREMSWVSDSVWLKGRIHMRLVDQHGTLKDERFINNLVTSAGKQEVIKLIVKDVGGAAFDWIAIGTGTGAAAAADTGLGVEMARSGVVGTAVQTTTTGDTAQFVITFGTTGNQSITESGVFNSTTNGTMLARQTFTAIAMASGDTLQITWKVQGTN